MADLAAIRAGIATNLRTVDRLRVLPYVPSEITADRAAVIEFDGAPDLRQSMKAPGSGTVQLGYTVKLLVPDNGDSGSAEAILDGLLNTDSTGVWAAIESDRTLNGAAHDCIVTEYGPYEWVNIPGNNARFVMGSLALRINAGG
jgi:hypothetical protein